MYTHTHTYVHVHLELPSIPRPLYLPRVPRPHQELSEQLLSVQSGLGPQGLDGFT